MLPPIDFKQWIEDHRHLLKPPVGNQVVYTDSEFIVMVVGGPNRRKDYHINEGEEFFYQLEGNMVLRIMEDGKPREIPISAGQIFLLPPEVPHSPQREEGSVGLVIERRRYEGELDGFAWYCERCSEPLHSEYLPVTNIVTQLPQVFERFHSRPHLHTCKACGHVMSPA